jgi:2-oxoglutarate ferredoxin oxidoreductase subunit alpha
MIGGEAGQGVQSVGFILAKAFSRGGYYVFADQDYESRIRGGHNFFRVRVEDKKLAAIAEPVDILLALNNESIDLHKEQLSERGVIVFDGEKTKDITTNDNAFGVPLSGLAEQKAGNKLMENTVALGVCLGLIKYDLEILEVLLREHFGAGEIGEANVRAARAGYDYAQANFTGSFDYRCRRISDAKRMLLNGNEAIALGAIAAGCRFMSAYPMTPATSIMEYMAAKAKDFGLVVVQPEDEIAAINMTIGASYAGARAMTATSGSGLCLMVEGIGLAGMTETPVVIVDGQRPGPAVGLPTRTEQGDLEFVFHAAHGEFPRAVLAPSTVEDAFWMTVKAFNLAEKYQMPVIILTDHHLATSYATVDKFDLSKVNIDRGVIFSAEETNESEYKRHEITESGISPRAFPGQQRALVVTDSDEHDEAGHLIEDAETRTQMVRKRMRKLFNLRREVAPPQLYGTKRSETLLLGWGSTYGAIREAVDILHKEGIRVSSLHMSELWPFPAEAIADAIDKAHRVCVIENNATGQLSHLIRRETGKDVSNKILKYDGRPFMPAHIVEEVKKEACYV